MEWKNIEPTIWKPENEGDSIEGTLIKVDKDRGKFKSVVYNLEVVEDGEIKQKFIFGTTILNDKMSYICIGDPIKIIYKGEHESNEGRVKDFDVFKGELDRITKD